MFVPKQDDRPAIDNPSDALKTRRREQFQRDDRNASVPEICHDVVQGHCTPIS
jgi:hypothetical protein